MTYVEWLRVRGALKWTAYVLGVLFLCAIGLRIYAFAKGDNMMAYVSGIQDDPGSKVSHSVLPDGTKETVIVDKTGKTNITIDDHGYAGVHIVIVDHSKSHDAEATEKRHNVSMGEVRVDVLPTGDGDRVTLDTGQPEPFIFYSAIAVFVSLIVATVLGAPFGRESDGHLEIALTKPISRTALSLEIIGVDVVGIVAAWAMTVVMLVVSHALFEAPHLTFGMADLVGSLCGLAGAIAWYAIICAGTASMKRGYGLIQGLSWPIALLFLGLGKANLGDQPILVVVHTIAQWVGYILPFTYLHFGPAMTTDGQAAGSMAFNASIELPALCALAVVYLALAVVQWRRVEA
jgi:hypothetical protein